jgi:hypothetical protein
MKVFILLPLLLAVSQLMHPANAQTVGSVRSSPIGTCGRTPRHATPRHATRAPQLHLQVNLADLEATTNKYFIATATEAFNWGKQLQNLALASRASGATKLAYDAKINELWGAYKVPRWGRCAAAWAVRRAPRPAQGGTADG